jgi:hypothetical protein
MKEKTAMRYISNKILSLGSVLRRRPHLYFRKMRARMFFRAGKIMNRTGLFLRKHVLLSVAIGAAPVLAVALFCVAYFTTNGTFDFSHPEAEVNEIWAIRGEELTADPFVRNVRDEKMPAFIRNLFSHATAPAEAETPRVSVYFDVAPDTSVVGSQEIAIMLEDAGGNQTKLTGGLTVLPGKTVVIAETGSDPSEINLEHFADIPEGVGARFVVPPDTLDFSVTNVTYDVPIELDGRVVDSRILVKDTTPPAATPVNRTVSTKTVLEAKDFVADTADATEVVCEFAAAPSFGSPAEQEVEIILRDVAGNETLLTAALSIVRDTRKPVIKGAKNRSVPLDGAVRYRDGVTVTDDLDDTVALSVDSSAVNLSVPGHYPVTYSATDDSGNEAVVTTRITVLSRDETTIYAKADEILAQIAREDMSLYDKAKAIHTWVSTHVKYTSRGEKTGIINGAYDAFFRGRGDCYTYYAASEVLLTRAGIANVPVTRIPDAPTRHFWNLVNVGTGWHHFDTCPAPINPGNTFLFTESQAQEYTERLASRRSEYYTYDHALYPEVVW